MNKQTPEKSPYATLKRTPIKAPGATEKKDTSFDGKTVFNSDMRAKGGNR